MRTIPNKNIRSAKVWGYALGVAFSTVCPAMGKTDSFFKEPVIFLHSGPNEKTTVQSIDRFGPMGISIELRLPAYRMGVKNVEEGSPGNLQKLKEEMPLGGNGESRSYMKSGGEETVKLSGSESNTVAFETGSSPRAADVRIKGSKRFVDNTITEVQDIIGVKASLSHVQLIAETKTYPGFKESHVTALEEELGKTMTLLGRSKSSFNGSATIKSAFEKGLNEVRLKLSEEYSALKVTIEGNREFVEGIKSLLNNIKKTTPTEA
jgi:hypothetical protein